VRQLSVNETSQPLTGRVLLVDDSAESRDVLGALLAALGHGVETAGGGREALERVKGEAFDLIILDIMMPEMDGYEVLSQLKQDAGTRHIPVLVLSGYTELDSVVRCVQMGAEDYLTKPFNRVLLQARIGACLEKKRLRDHEMEMFRQLSLEKENSDRLLLNILPAPIANRLRAGEQVIVDSFASVTVLFSDIVGFSQLAARLSANELVRTLNEVFSRFDSLAGRFGLEKIKTIGDAYMAVGGLPERCDDHAVRAAEMALAMQEEIINFSRETGYELSIRVGLHTGPVIAGVIGKHKFSYDLWGDTVNIASRMESHGHPSAIQVTAETERNLRDRYLFVTRGRIAVKGQGELMTYLLVGRLG
jgi:adenylate cyclase